MRQSSSPGCKVNTKKVVSIILSWPNEVLYLSTIKIARYRVIFGDVRMHELTLKWFYLQVLFPSDPSRWRPLMCELYLVRRQNLLKVKVCGRTWLPHHARWL